MTDTTTMNIELSAALKRDADELFESMGMDTGTAVRVFLTQAVSRREMPFRMTEPRDANGFTRAEVTELLRRKEDLEAGRGKIHELIEV